MERLLGASQERNCPVFAVMKNPAVTATFPARTRQSLENFVHFIERTRAALQSEALARDAHGLQKWGHHFLDEIGYLAELRRSEKNPETADSRIRNLTELLSSLDGAEAPRTTPAERLQSFLEEITLDTEREEEEENAGNAVTLITMHSCKGLEFPHVSIVGLEEGLLPHSRSKTEGTLDEERRLFYVAITRAMQTLTISYCTGRKKYGQIVPAHPSSFLKDLPEDLVEHADAQSRQPVPPASGKQLFAMMRDSLG